jgi:hypothetical protein
VGLLQDKKVGVDRLLRNVTVARESFLTHSKRLEATRITAALDQHSLSEIGIVEHPYATHDTDLTRRILIIGLG